MKKKLNKVAKDTNLFLKKFILKQKKTELLKPIRYGLLPGGKKIRSKLIIDIGKIFKIKYHKLIQIAAAVECIHAYSLIHDDLPCMDNDRLRRGKLSISPDGILIKSKLNFFKNFKLSISKGEEINPIFLFLAYWF